LKIVDWVEVTTGQRPTQQAVLLGFAMAQPNLQLLPKSCL